MTDPLTAGARELAPVFCTAYENDSVDDPMRPEVTYWLHELNGKILVQLPTSCTSNGVVDMRSDPSSVITY